MVDPVEQIPARDVDLEDEAAQKERKEHADGVRRVNRTLCIAMSEQKPPSADKDRRYLHEEQHGAKDNHDIHEVEGLIESGYGDNMMCVSLIIQGWITFDDTKYEEKVYDEVATCVNKCPDMNVSDSVNAFITVEYSLFPTANIKHCNSWKDGADYSMNDRSDICSIFSLFDVIHITVDSFGPFWVRGFSVGN